MNFHETIPYSLIAEYLQRRHSFKSFLLNCLEWKMLEISHLTWTRCLSNKFCVKWPNWGKPQQGNNLKIKYNHLNSDIFDHFWQDDMQSFGWIPNQKGYSDWQTCPNWVKGINIQHCLLDMIWKKKKKRTGSLLKIKLMFFLLPNPMIEKEHLTNNCCPTIVSYWQHSEVIDLSLCTEWRNQS